MVDLVHSSFRKRYSEKNNRYLKELDLLNFDQIPLKKSSDMKKGVCSIFVFCLLGSVRMLVSQNPSGKYWKT